MQEAVARTRHEGDNEHAAAQGQEPPPADDPLFSVENTVLSPHTAASSQQAMRRMELNAVRGIPDILGDADALSPPAGVPWQAVNPGYADAGEREAGG